MQLQTAHMHGHLLGGLLLISLLIGAPLVGAVDIGEPAPDFTLPSTTGATIRLSQFKGKKNVLIEFYSVDFNPT